MSRFKPRHPVPLVNPTCFGAGPSKDLGLCRTCPVAGLCAESNAMWGHHKSLRETVRLLWAAARTVGSPSDPKHVYETEWRRLFSGTATNAEQELSDQLLNPFTTMALESVADACAMRKVPLWLFIRAQMDMVKVLINAQGVPFDVRQLESRQRWDRYDKYRALLDRNGPVEHSSTADMNSEWIKATTYAARDETEIGRLIVEDRTHGGKLSRADAIVAVDPCPEWRAVLGSLRDRAKATGTFGVHLADTAYTLARLEAVSAVTSCYWSGFPDRIGINPLFTWDDVARLVTSVISTGPATAVEVGKTLAHSWRPCARPVDEV